MDIVEEMNRAMRKCRKEVKEYCEGLGQDAVDYAKSNATFTDVTGNLRKSYYYKVLDDGLVIGNSADYASNVEARGKEVFASTVDYIKSKI